MAIKKTQQVSTDDFKCMQSMENGLSIAVMQDSTVILLADLPILGNVALGLAGNLQMMDEMIATLQHARTHMSSEVPLGAAVH